MGWTTCRTHRSGGKPLAVIVATLLAVGGFATFGIAPAVAATAGSISGGERHTCAVMTDTSARCWGDNSNGQLGNAAGAAYAPVPVTSTTGTTITGITQIAAGGSHTCARFNNGTARCWGANAFGQLGDGSTADRPHPVFVRKADNTPLTGVVSLATGGTHTCAVLTDGTARCWGAGSSGQVGDGGTSSRTRPVAVTASSGAPLTGVTALAAGTTHTCARLSTGQARCWGLNGNGQLGDATTANRSRAAVVLNTDRRPLTGIAQVTGGGTHSCARFTNGTVRCWGGNGFGQIGDGSFLDRPGPAFVRPTGSTVLTGVSAVTAGNYHTCARLTTGQVRCWGSNDGYELGNGDTTGASRNRPATVVTSSGAPLVGATHVVVGQGQGCARLTTGQLRCWGANNRGQVGDGTTVNKVRAVPVVAVSPTAPGAAPVVAAGAGAISAGGSHTCAVLTDTSARCWGQNLAGQLGGVTRSAFTPAPVTSTTGVPITGITQIAAGGSHTCARFNNGTARCWGNNERGQLGDGSTTNRPNPVFVRNADNTPLTGIAAVTAGAEHSCAMLTDGSVRCWGFNGLGQLGDGTTTVRTRPVPVTDYDGTDLTGVTSMAAGQFHTCARLSSGQGRCWGSNLNSQLGDATTVGHLRGSVILNTDYSVLTGIAEMAAGDTHSCARFTNGTVRCWGYNGYGSLGDGTNTDRPGPAFVRPTPSTVLTGVVTLTARGFQTCARLSTGQARCWGLNGLGQLGDGTTTDSNRPVAVTSVGGAAVTAATQVVAGDRHACARLTSGQMRCWGSGTEGQIGDGTNRDRLRAVPVVDATLTGVAGG